MKKLIYLLLFISFIGCSEFYPPDERFTVTKIESFSAEPSRYKYHLVGIKGYCSFYMTSDSLYIVGDTLTLIK